ncbi:MAG TPA: hypothetical protein ENK82_00625 [Campylobacterales bacterium]|nr:hypothetical protein [Campylobacterales bacterium]HHS91827.1 hypothetical protein [Campylobacterales bacterium]
MEKIGLKFFKEFDYEVFESLQYWLDYDFEYDDLVESIENKAIIELDLEEDEDRAEDIEMLSIFLSKFKALEIPFELYVKREDWEVIKLEEIS